MALTPEELKEFEALKRSSNVRPEFRTAGIEKLAAGEDEHLAGWAAAGGTKADAAPVVPGELGLKGIIGGEGQGGAPSADAEAAQLAGKLDPRFSLVPQVLALQPATTHPGGDEAAKQDWQAGKKDVTFVYEPPVAAVRKQLLENPAFVRALRPDSPPEMDEIASMDSGSSLYQSAADHMWRKTAEAAAQSGRTVARYSQTPWLWSDKSIPQTLKLKLQGAAPEMADAANAFVMGVDDTGAFGAGRATQEAASPTSMASGARMGINEGAPQSTADLNSWNAAEHPVAYTAGQALGALHPWGAANRLWEGVQQGGGWLAQAAAKTRLGGVVADLAPSWMKTAAGVVGDAATGGVAAAGTQAVQEGVDAAARGQAPDMSEAGERVKDAGQFGLELAAGGSALGRLAHAGAEHIRDSDRYGQGLVRRTEPNLDWRVRSAITGPGLNAETKATVDAARKGGHQPGDVIAEEIAPKIQQAATENTTRAKGAARAETANFSRTAEGAAEEPMTHLQEMSLEKLRDHHQPREGGGLHAVDDKARPAQKVFNSLVREVSTEPVKGAIKLDADEAGSFLGARWQRKLLAGDLEAAAAKRSATPIDRKAYLQTVSPKQRLAVDEEIEASIDDAFQDRHTGGMNDKPIDKRSAEYKDAEQKVLREHVDADTVLEPFGGSFADYLRQRGKNAVYVTPQAYDARRTETLMKGLSDPDLAQAAKYDRERRPMGGQKGGWAARRGEHDAAIAKAEGIEKEVAPGGDAFKPLAGLYQSSPGEKQLVDKVRDLADQSGVRGQLDRLRGMQDTLAVRNRAVLRGADGRPRGYFNPTNWIDAAPLRAFPVLKSLEGPLGPLRGGNAARAALLGNGEDAAAERNDEAGPRGRYEGERALRMKEIGRAKTEADVKRAKRRMRRERAAGGKP